MSVAVHGAIAIALFAVRLTVQPEITPLRSTAVLLMAPMKRIAVPARPKQPEIRAELKLPPARLPAPTPLLLEPPVLKAAPPIPAIVAETPKPAALPQPTIHAEVFPSAPVAKPIAMAAQVQTGGFSTASTASSQPAKVQQVAAAGFGDAGVTSVTASSGRAVRAAGFGNAAPRMSAAQVLEKPRPAYSDEARRLHIEGEVQLEVLFRASGEVDILRVVRGLGHGLDENAAQAARTIRFLPAKRDGQAVDSTATVHIIFQLAS